MNRKLLNLCFPSFVALSYSHQWWTEPMSATGDQLAGCRGLTGVWDGEVEL